MFVANQCPINFDKKDQYTSRDNPASIQIINGQLKLMVNLQFKDSNNSDLNNEYLKELIHELGAVLLIQQLVEKMGTEITSKEILSYYKSQLLLPGTKVGLTHLVDAVLLSLIQEYKK